MSTPRGATIMPAVVQIVALARTMMGQYHSLWTGSGTIIEPSGYILTNCHVAAPQEMGMPAKKADVLAVALTQRSDEAPTITYFCQVVVISPGLDLAVVRITHDTRGRPVTNLSLPTVPLGDSNKIDLGDPIYIYGYPGIGGETITFTSGNVSGFAAEHGIQERRAWIKTDATIAGGNSGGTAVDANGSLVGIPTRAGAGDAAPVDARPVLDTNRDGRVDERDTPMAIGGFINSLRPINLAMPLIQKALGGRMPAPATLPGAPAPAQGGTPTFVNLLFGSEMGNNGRISNPVSVIPSGAKDLFAVFEYDNLRQGTPWSYRWELQGKAVAGGKQLAWDGPEEGHRMLSLNQPSGLPDGTYRLTLSLNGRDVLAGEVSIAALTQAAVTVAGRVLDAATGAGLPDARVVLLRPGITPAQFLQRNDRQTVLSITTTGRDGSFRLPDKLARNQRYSMIVAAKDYTDWTAENGVALPPTAPAEVVIPPIGLQPTKAPAAPPPPRTDLEPRTIEVTSGGSFGMSS